MIKKYMIFVALLAFVTLMILLLTALPLGIELREYVCYLVWSG